ncbi:MAG TPA: hypothetical protein VHT50_00700, partial [Mycobacterium sp.]|nr:hypothetical protein [Mycobacterium sp.]
PAAHDSHVVAIIDALLKSDEPAVRWKVRSRVLDEDPESRPMVRLRNEIRRSPRVRTLVECAAGASYRKWSGGHWVLITLADIGYPPGDRELEPLAERVMQTWLAPRYYAEFETATSQYKQAAVPLMNGRYRRCGSQQGGALLAAVTLGVQTAAADRLVERLLHWQWPDGGWNCSRKPTAATSSVYETLLPMRGLAAYARVHRDVAARDGCDRAAEVLLTRRMLYRRTTGTLIRAEWAKLHYPSYWYYDVLSAAKGLAEADLLGDDRCRDGLDLLESKRLPDGGWAAEGKYYNAPGARGQAEIVGWGGVNARKANEWVTVDALAVLHAAGRL